MLCVIFTEQHQINAKELTESVVLQQFYGDLQSEVSIDDFLPLLVTKKVITIHDKGLITESGRGSNERCKFFLDQYISKPLSTGNTSTFYKFLQLIDASPKYTVLTARIKQFLMVETLQDEISGMFT